MNTFEIKVSTIVKIILTFFAFAILYYIRGVFVYIILAFIISSAVSPLINFLERKKIPRILATILVYLLILLFFVFIFWFFIPPFVNQIQEVSTNLPIWLDNFQNIIQKYKNLNLPPQLINGLESAISGLISKVSQIPTKFFNLFSKISSALFGFFFLVILSIYLSFEKDIDKRFAKFIFPKHKNRQDNIILFWNKAQEVISKWFQGYIISAIIVGLFVWISFSILGIQYSAIIAIISGFCEIIPLFGPTFALIVALILTSFQNLHLLIWIVLIFLIIQQLDNYLFLPFIMRNRVQLNPLITLIAAFVGGKFGGILGMVAAIPICAVLVEYWKLYQLKFSK